jgi:ATP-dependent DNA ligase
LVQKRGYEGLVAKHDESKYQEGESRSWVKVKARQDGTFIVGGISLVGLARLQANNLSSD